MTSKCIVWVKTWCSTCCTLKIDHLNADVVCIFVFFQILMWAAWCWCWWWWVWEIKKTVYLITLPPCPGQPHWPGSYHWTPSPQSSHLPICVAAGFPLSLSHHLSPHWGQGDIHEVTFWCSLTQRRGSIVWTWSLWKMKLVFLTRDFKLPTCQLAGLFLTHSYCIGLVLYSYLKILYGYMMIL